MIRRPLTIGVVGGSGSGRTTVARAIESGLDVDVADDVRFIRRLRRDVTERGRAVEDVIRQYLETVRPMHLEFVEPSKRWADVILPEGGHNRVGIGMLQSRVALELGRRRAGG